MAFFDETVAAALAGQVVRAAVLVLFDFASQAKRVWLGHGPLLAGGHRWSGLGELGSIEGLESAIAGTAPQPSFKLSGVDGAIVTETLAAASEVKGRVVTVFLQMLDTEFQPLDASFAIYVGLMDVLKVQATGVATRTVEVTAESPWTRRSMPAWGYLSDRDQNRLFPGDRGLELVPSMANKTVVWPPAFESDDDD